MFSGTSVPCTAADRDFSIIVRVVCASDVAREGAALCCADHNLPSCVICICGQCPPPILVAWVLLSPCLFKQAKPTREVSEDYKQQVLDEMISSEGTSVPSNVERSSKVT
jgi:hypothetical protein